MGTFTAVLSSAYHLTRLIGSLLGAYLTIRMQFGRAERAYRRQLIEDGVSEKVAEVLAADYAKRMKAVINSLMSFRNLARMRSGVN